MDEHKDNQMSRKGFLGRASAGLLTLGLLRGERFRSFASQTEDKPAFSQYRLLGRTGIRVTPVGFGASRTMEPMLLKSALESGINFIDTGRYYFNGQNEVMVGKVLQGIRKEVIIQSKIKLEPEIIGRDLGSTEASDRITNLLRSRFAESLKALQTDYIDILLVHEAASIDVLNHDAVLEFFQSTKDAGQIRACGFSSHENQLTLIKSANKIRFYDVVMVPFNHQGSYTHSNTGDYTEWDQSALEKELAKAQSNDIGVMAMKTCSAGPYAFKDEDQPSYKSALKWILNHSYIATMAVAMGNLSELKEDLQAMS